MTLVLLLAMLAAALLATALTGPAGGGTGRRSRLVRVAPALVGLGLLVVDCTLGWRWQQFPIAVGLLVLLLLSSLPTPRGRPPGRRGWWRWAATLLAAGIVLGGTAAAWALPRLDLPTPDGPHPVGTTVVEWVDPDRTEPATADPADRRVVVAQLWYPAADEPAPGDRAWYFGTTRTESRQVGAGVAAQFGVPAFLLDGAAEGRTHAGVDAAPATTDRPWPVVLFSPGLTGVRTQNTVLAENLASHGYLVVGVDHPYDSAAVVRRDGTVLTSRIRATGNDGDDARAAVAATQLRAEDLRFVLTRVSEAGQEPGPATLPAQVCGHADPTTVAAVGHSLGGAAAVRAATLDPRFDSVVLLDSYPWTMDELLPPGGHPPGEQPAGPGQPPPTLALVASQALSTPQADAEYAAALDHVLRSARAPSYRLTVPDAGHLTLTDAPELLPPGVAGGLDRDRGPLLVAAATRAHLDGTLRHDRARHTEDRLARLGPLTRYAL